MNSSVFVLICSVENITYLLNYYFSTINRDNMDDDSF